MEFETIQLRVEPPVCRITLHRPEAGNAITAALVDECRRALKHHAHGDSVHIVVLEGSSESFCLGADFRDYAESRDAMADPEALYDLWAELAQGPFVSIAHVRGKANAGGVGFAASCDIVLADRSAEFSLSELLFGLLPACVLPFLIRRVGAQRAHYMTLTTKSVPAQQAFDWGLVDACADDSVDLLRKHLLRLKHLPKAGIRRYKSYRGGLDAILAQSRAAAVATNRQLFSDPEILKAIRRFAETQRFPWED
jgi:polyketide biosynthesis enoyl-CoA hydratase PksH